MHISLKLLLLRVFFFKVHAKVEDCWRSRGDTNITESAQSYLYPLHFLLFYLLLLKEISSISSNTNNNSLRSRRLEVAGERENGRARGRHATPSRVPVFSWAHYFQAPATQAKTTIKQHAKMECCFARRRDTHITEPAQGYVYPLFLCSLAEGISSISSTTTSNTTRVKTGIKQHAKMENCGARRGIHISLTRRRDMCIPSLVLDFLSYPLLNEILSVILI